MVLSRPSLTSLLGVLSWLLSLTFVSRTTASSIVLTASEGPQGAPPEVLAFQDDEVLVNTSSSRSMSHYLRPRLLNNVRRETKPVEYGLVVRILTPRSGGGSLEPLTGFQEAYQIAFGNSLSAKRQFYDCSGGQLDFRPFRDGVINVRVSRSIGNYDRHQLKEEAYQLVCQQLGQPSNCNVRNPPLDIDHIMFVAPSGVRQDEPLGYLFAAVGGEWSMFGDSTAYQKAAFAPESIGHEVAHNWGIGHSEDQNSIAGGDGMVQDNSNLMGGSFYLYPGDSTGDYRCYNAFNYQTLGWHKDRFTIIPEGQSRMLEIGGISQYRQLNSQQTLFVQYGNFYISYNLNHGFMSRLKEYPDRLLVVQPEDLGYAKTFVKAALGVGQTYRSGSFKVTVCGDNWESNSSVQTLYVAVGANAECVASALPPPSPTNRPTPQPSPVPTPLPSERPTPSPTWWPTPQPSTRHPTPEPTPSPTPPPTPYPTPFPTREPTLSPTPLPTPSPTWWPTPQPSTRHPTPEPTPSPTQFPTPEPTWWPTPQPSTQHPTPEPTPSPSMPPSPFPTPFPTAEPTLWPSQTPTTVHPTPFPTASPTPPPVQNTNLPTTTTSPTSDIDETITVVPPTEAADGVAAAASWDAEVAPEQLTFQTCNISCEGNHVRMCLVWDDGRQRDVCVPPRVFEKQALSKPSSYCGYCSVASAAQQAPTCPTEGCRWGRVKVCIPRSDGEVRAKCVQNRHWERIFASKPDSTCGPCAVSS